MTKRGHEELASSPDDTDASLLCEEVLSPEPAPKKIARSQAPRSLLLLACSAYAKATMPPSFSRLANVGCAGKRVTCRVLEEQRWGQHCGTPQSIFTDFADA